MLYLGVDLGTSSVKVLLVDEAGVVCKTASRTYPLEFPQPGWSQQNPADWWSATQACISELMDGTDAAQVKGLAVGGQMHGLVVLDEQDQVICPAILWNDGRTGEETRAMNGHFGKEKLLSLAGNIAFAGFTAPKLLWMRSHEPDNFAKIRKIMLPKDYVVYRLTGVHSCDYSDASGMLLLDVANRRWSQELLTYCGVTEAQMPKLFESYETVGTVEPEVAQALGLPEGVVVAAGAGDNAAAAVGTGTAFAHADGAYHLMGCILSAASAYGWWTKEILKAQSDNDEQNPVTDEALGRNPVFFLPYLMGERSPHNDPDARGAFLGMTMDTTRYQLTQAVLEGVAFAIRDSVEIARSLGIHVTESGLCGGGAKSPLWRKIMANVLHMEMQVPVMEEGAGYGGAILAMVAAGAYPTVRDACAALRTERRIYKPDPAIAARYEERYQVYRSLYPVLKSVYPSLAYKE